MSKEQKIRFELEVGGAKAFLAPLTFAVAEAALGLTMTAKPKFLTAGEIIINSLWIRGSKTLQSGGVNFNEACMKAYGCIDTIQYKYKDGNITISLEGKEYNCKIGEIKREALEEAIGLIRPYVGNPRPLTAGKTILLESWVSGDEEIKTKDELLIPACLAAYYLINFKGANLKKV
ncbi:hypothetical protein [Flavobacterium phage FPSV-S1]|nr:hypothetical protein [Flavobacterium phage FPSV-S1]QCW20486.1 hypothetical protein [Flavobacterium phage FPSV-S8]QCW20649.1 hypothetical protein [Flavobacterium phage FPSV-S27]